MNKRKFLVVAGFASLSLLVFSGCAKNAEYEIDRYENFGTCNQILIDATSSKVAVMPSTDGKVRVECKALPKTKYYVGMQGDTLVVKYNPKWHQRLFSGIAFGNDKTSAVIYLPEGEYNKLTVDITSGSAEISEGYTFGTAELETTSGSLHFASDVLGELSAECTSGEIALSGVDCNRLDTECTSGEITLSGVHCAALEMDATSGEMNLSDVTVSGGLELEFTSGEISFSNVTAENACMEWTSGDVSANGLMVSQLMQISVTSGTMAFERCDAGSMKISVTSGSVCGTLLTPKNFSVRQGSGRVDVPDDGDGGVCKITVTSGRVQLSILEE